MIKKRMVTISIVTGVLAFVIGCGSNPLTTTRINETNKSADLTINDAQQMSAEQDVQTMTSSLEGIDYSSFDIYDTICGSIGCVGDEIDIPFQN